jgi:isopenicillin-N N-acyltransferase like protein
MHIPVLPLPQHLPLGTKLGRESRPGGVPRAPTPSVTPLTLTQWDIRQQPNLIALTIVPETGPKIAMITEAGLIGKVGFNSFSVGVCLNAIRVLGVSFSKLPIHLALRAALNSTSAATAIATLEKAGVASAEHVLVADKEGGTGMEWSALGCRRVQPNEGWVARTNQFLCGVPVGVGPAVVLEDSQVRMVRISQLLRGETTSGEKMSHENHSNFQKAEGKEMTVEDVERILEDEQGFPCSINRAAVDGKGFQTLFSIVIDLRGREGWVRVGRSTEGCERVVLRV